MNYEIETIFLGASGFIGKKLTDKFNSKKIIKTYNNNYIKNGVKIDLEKTNLNSFFKNFPNSSKVYILGGLTDFSQIIKNPEKAYNINVKCMKFFLDEIFKRNIKPVFFSSESVFDGLKGNYKETDLPCPVFEYGKFKKEIEDYIINNFENYLIFRLSKVFDSKHDSGTLITSWLNKIISNENILCANDNFFSPIHVDDLVEIIFRIDQKDFTKGIYHLSSNEHLSRKNMLTKVLKQLPISFLVNNKITYQPLRSFKNAQFQPLNTTLDSSKVINEYNYRPSNFNFWINKIINQKYYLEKFNKNE